MMMIQFPPDELNTEEAYRHVAAIKNGSCVELRTDYLNLSDQLTEYAAILYQRTCIYLEVKENKKVDNQYNFQFLTPIDNPHILDKPIAEIRMANKLRLELVLGRATLRYSEATYTELLNNLVTALHQERSALNLLNVIEIGRKNTPPLVVDRYKQYDYSGNANSGRFGF